MQPVGVHDTTAMLDQFNHLPSVSTPSAFTYSTADAYPFLLIKSGIVSHIQHPRLDQLCDLPPLRRRQPLAKSALWLVAAVIVLDSDA